MTTTYPYLRPDAPPPALAPRGRSGVRRALQGPVGQPTWVRPSVLALLAGTALLYLTNLGASGNANQFYAAAVQAGTKSWKAMFFGSLDSGNFITVDKPPASLWPMEIAGRIFGFNSWSMLVPQALMGVAAVGLLYLTVKRWFGPAAGLIAGGLLAVTPVAVLMFRFNNPDALMTLLLVVAAYGVTRAIDDGKLRWLVVAGAAMGFDFLTKSLQPFTVLPALAIVYLVTANTTLGRRIRNLLLAGAAMVVSGGWWVLAVTLTPASSRPYIGGSGNNSVWGLAWGYNGLNRLTGGVAGTPGGSQGGGGTGPTGQLPGIGGADLAAGGGPGGGGGGGGGFGGSSGLGRMFNSDFGTQISWLLPAALVAVVALFVVARRAPRTDRTRAAALLWGGWLLVTAGVFSYASGIIHPYYAVQLAPAIAALVAIGAVVLWRRRAAMGARLTLAAGVAVTGVWSYELMTRAADWYPWLRYALLFISLVAAVAIAVPPKLISRRGVAVAALAGVLALGGGSAAYAADTAATPHAGSIPSAGPSSNTASGVSGLGGAKLIQPAGERERTAVGTRRNPRWVRAGSSDLVQHRTRGAARGHLHPLGRGNRRRPKCGQPRIGQWRQGRHRYWWLEWIRSDADTRAIQGVCRRRRDPLLHCRRSGRRPGRRRRNQQRDHQLGDVKLHGHLRRRSDGL